MNYATFVTHMNMTIGVSEGDLVVKVWNTPNGYEVSEPMTLEQAWMRRGHEPSRPYVWAKVKPMQHRASSFEEFLEWQSHFLHTELKEFSMVSVLEMARDDPDTYPIRSYGPMTMRQAYRFVVVEGVGRNLELCLVGSI